MLYFDTNTGEYGDEQYMVENCGSYIYFFESVMAGEIYPVEDENYVEQD